MQRTLIAFALLAVALSGCRPTPPAEPQANEAAATNTGAAAEQPPAQVLDRSNAGRAAPTASFLKPDGSKVSIADFKGKPVLVNLWATWCAPCVAEMPLLDTLAGQNATVQVVTVSQDSGDESRTKVQDFFATKKFAHIQAYRDPEAALSDAFKLVTMPTTVLFDKDGKEVWRVIGPEEWASPKAATLIAEAG